jgi:formate dehydrogenase subunit delta
MKVEPLIAWANDIATFFDTSTDKEAAIEGVRHHMSRFWDPRMRRAMIAHVQAGGAGLSPTAVAAVKALAPLANSSNQ